MGFLWFRAGLFKLCFFCAFFSLFLATVSVISAQEALAVPEEEVVSHILQASKDAIELSNFEAALLLENHQSLHHTLEIMEQAQKRLALSTFVWKNDRSGQALAYAAIRAVKRGVPTEVFIDGLQLRNPGNHALYKAMVREGVRVFIFRPPHLFPLRVNRRLHDKSLMTYAEGGRFVVMKNGGRNISDHHLDDEHTVDVESIARLAVDQGELVFQKQFDDLRRQEDVVPFLVGAPDPLAHARMMISLEASYFRMRQATATWGKVALHWETVKRGLFLFNGRRGSDATMAIRHLIQRAAKSVTIANAYFIPNVEYRRLFWMKKSQGVEVAVFTNSEASTPKSFVVTALRNHIQELVASGVKLFLRRRGEIHAKATAVDGEALVVGSVNKDQRSESLQAENALILFEPTLAQAFEAEMKRQSDGGQYLMETADRPRSFLSQCASFLLSKVEEQL